MSCAVSSRVRGVSITVSTPLRPRIEGSERARSVMPYSPFKTLDKGMTFLASLATDSTM